MNACPKCQAPIDPGARFCGVCGANMALEASAAAETPQDNAVPAVSQAAPAAYDTYQQPAAYDAYSSYQQPVAYTSYQPADAQPEAGGSETTDPADVAFTVTADFSVDEPVPAPEPVAAPKVAAQAAPTPQPVGAPQLTSPAFAPEEDPSSPVQASNIVMTAAPNDTYIPGKLNHRSPMKLIVGLAAALLIVGGAAAAFLFLDFSGNPADRVEKSLKATADSIIDAKTVDALFGLDFLNALLDSPSRALIQFGAEDMSVNATLQSDPSGQKTLLDITLDPAAGSAIEGSVYMDGTKAYLSFPTLLNKTLSLDLNQASNQWNDSFLGGLYALSDEEKEALDAFAAGDNSGSDAAARRAELERIYNTLLDSFEYKEMKKQETPAGTALDCVAVTVPAEALIAFVRDASAVEDDAMTSALAGIMGSGLSSASELDNMMRKLNAVTLHVYYDSKGARCVSADLSLSSGERNRLLAYAETKDAKNPLASWEASIIVYTNDVEEGRVTVTGKYSYVSSTGHAHNIQITSNENGAEESMGSLILLWNPEQVVNNLSLFLEYDNETVALTGHYRADRSRVSIGLAEISRTNYKGETERSVMDLSVTVEKGSAVAAPDYVSGAKDFFAVSDEEWMGIMFSFIAPEPFDDPFDPWEENGEDDGDSGDPWDDAALEDILRELQGLMEGLEGLGIE